MSSNDSIEVTAATIDQAINQALAHLGADQDDVKIEVLSTPRAGVLGFGARQARVRVTRRAPEGASSGVTSPPPAPPVVRQPHPAAPSAPPKPRTEMVSAPVEEITSEIEPQDEMEEMPVSTTEPAPLPLRTDPAALAREATSVLARILELMGEKAEI